MKFLYNLQLGCVRGSSAGRQNGPSDSFCIPVVLLGLGCCGGLAGAGGIYSNQNLVRGAQISAEQDFPSA